MIIIIIIIFIIIIIIVMITTIITMTTIIIIILFFVTSSLRLRLRPPTVPKDPLIFPKRDSEVDSSRDVSSRSSSRKRGVVSFFCLRYLDMALLSSPLSSIFSSSLPTIWPRTPLGLLENGNFSKRNWFSSPTSSISDRGVFFTAVF